MTRGILKALVVAAALGAAPEAKAQFFPTRPGAYYNTPFGNYAYNMSYQSSLSVAWVNPFTRQPYFFNYRESYSGAPFGGGYSSAPYMRAPSFYQPNYYSSGSMGNRVVRDQLRFFAGGPQAPAPAAPKRAPKPLADAVVVKPQIDAAMVKGQPVAVDPKLVAPADGDTASGTALNALALAIRDLEAKGAKADSPLLPAELLGKVQFTGGPGATAIMALRDGVPAMPEPLLKDELAAVRTNLEKPLADVAASLLKGKAVPAIEADTLANGLKKAKDAVPAKLKDLPAKQAAEVNAFLDTVDDLVRAATDPALEGVVVAKWSTVGASVADLVRHLGKHKLAFGPSNGNDDVYRALQRGLVTYYTTLAGNGVK